MTRQLGGQSQLDRAAVTETGHDQDALSQQERGTVEHGAASLGPRVERGGIDHERRRSVAPQELTPGDEDRFARRTALGEASLLHVLQPLQRRHLPGSS